MTDTPAPTATDAPVATPEAARAEIARLTSGADPAFVAAYANGDAASKARMTALHKIAYPDPAPDAAAQGSGAADPAASPGPPLPFVFAAEVPVAQLAEVNALAYEMAENLGMGQQLLRGTISTLGNAIKAREGRDMDAIELASLDAKLQARWGDDYDARMDAVEAALRKAGRSADWLRRSVLAAGPQAAAWAFETLAGLGRKGR